MDDAGPPSPRRATASFVLRHGDSPWLWLLTFSLFGLVALFAMGSRYGRLQSRIERQDEARRIVAREAAGVGTGVGAADDGGPIVYSTPERTRITLWPLRAVAAIVCVVSAVFLRREVIATRVSEDSSRLDDDVASR